MTRTGVLPSAASLASPSAYLMLGTEHEDVVVLHVVQRGAERLGVDRGVDALCLGLLAHLLDEQARGHTGVAGEQDLHVYHFLSWNGGAFFGSHITR